MPSKVDAFTRGAAADAPFGRSRVIQSRTAPTGRRRIFVIFLGISIDEELVIRIQCQTSLLGAQLLPILSFQDPSLPMPSLWSPLFAFQRGLSKDSTSDPIIRIGLPFITNFP